MMSKKKNTKKKVALIGSGMLGWACARVLSKNSNIELKLYGRDAERLYKIAKICEIEEYFYICDFFGNDEYHECDYCINTIGKIKPVINEQDADSIAEAIEINSLFPYKLSCNQYAGIIINPATDCALMPRPENRILDGINGRLNEKENFIADDVYGRTKYYGEIKKDNVKNLRASIIGPEFESNKSLLHWFLGLKRGTEVKGFTKHFWNGLTTIEWARIVENIIVNDLELKLPNLTHIVPADSVSKYELLKLFQKYYNREDIIIKPDNRQYCDRTLETIYPEVNSLLWGGEPKTIEQMVKQMAEFK